MQRQRGELVPIGEVVADLDGPVQAIREASPQALHHFTQADQVSQLVTASEADADLGFMVRLMALCSLPRTNPGNQKEYKRVNGPYTLYMIAGGGNKLPHGNLPRLLAGLGVHRSGADPKPRARPGEVAFQVHADIGGVQQRRPTPNPPPQSNEAALWLHRVTDLRRRAR